MKQKESDVLLRSRRRKVSFTPQELLFVFLNKKKYQFLWKIPKRFSQLGRLCQKSKSIT